MSDLSVKIDETKLKIRVAGLLSTPRGYLFEKSDNGYIFPVGGKVMVGEFSKDAMVREVMEEIGMKVGKADLACLLENIYGGGEDKVHELCFVYRIGDIFEGELPPGFVEVPVTELDAHPIRPEVIKELLRTDEDGFRHVIHRDSV